MLAFEYTAQQKEEIHKQKVARLKKFDARRAKSEEKRLAYSAEHSKLVKSKPKIQWWEVENATKSKKG